MNSPTDPSHITTTLRALGLDPAVPLNPVLPAVRGIEDMLDQTLAIGRAAGVEDTARRLVVEMRNRLFAAAECVNPYADGPSVVVLSSLNPVTIGGLWIPQMVERAGGRYPWIPTVAREGTGEAVGPQHGERLAGMSREMKPAEFVEEPPEAIVFALAAMSLEDAAVRATELLASARFASTPAARAGRVAVVDASRAFAVAGPELVDGFEWLVGWLQDRPQLMPQSLPWRALGS
jgi:iron complex transport system substrate-binding protein